MQLKLGQRIDLNFKINQQLPIVADANAFENRQPLTLKNEYTLRYVALIIYSQLEYASIYERYMNVQHIDSLNRVVSNALKLWYYYDKDCNFCLTDLYLSESNQIMGIVSPIDKDECKPETKIKYHILIA